jgi:Ca2+-binding EF-hand superfamily protein
VGEAFKAWDKDRNGSLSLVEFRTGWQQVQRVAETQARLRHQFGMVDVNKNNAIDPAEYGSLVLVKQAGKNAPQMSVFDANRDGKLAFGEYVRLVQALAPESGKGAAK